MPKSVSSVTSKATVATDANDATDAIDATDAAENQLRRHHSRGRSKKKNREIDEDREGQRDGDEDARSEQLDQPRALVKQDIIQLNKISPQLEDAKAKAKVKSSPPQKYGPIKSRHHHHHHSHSPKGKSKISRKSKISGKSRASGTSKSSSANQPLNETLPKSPQAILRTTAPPPPPPIQPIIKHAPPQPKPKVHIPDIKMYIYDKYAAKYTVRQLEMVLSKSYYTGLLVAITFWTLFLCTGIVIDYLQYDIFLLKESTYHIVSSYDVGLVSSARSNKFGWSILLVLILLIGCLISYFALSRSHLVVGLTCISLIGLQAGVIVSGVMRDYKPSFKVEKDDMIPVVHRMNLAFIVIVCGCWVIWQSVHYFLATITIRRLHNPADHFYESSGV